MRIASILDRGRLGVSRPHRRGHHRRLLTRRITQPESHDGTDLRPDDRSDRLGTAVAALRPSRRRARPPR